MTHVKSIDFKAIFISGEKKNLNIIWNSFLFFELVATFLSSVIYCSMSYPYLLRRTSNMVQNLLFLQ